MQRKCAIQTVCGVLLGAVFASGFNAVASAEDGYPEVELAAYEVRSLPLARASTDYAQPTSIVAGRELEERMAVSLGATLDGLAGVSATHYFPGASRPIIRGFSNDRIRVLADGIGTLDASVGSLDHAVTAEPLLVERIEILRGPATLLYGSNAVGGVVNVIDGRVPREAPERVGGGLGGVFTAAADGWTGRGNLGGPAGASWVWQSAGLVRRHGDQRIPGFAARDPELQVQQEPGRLFHSFVDSDQWTAGLSRLFDHGFAGGAVTRFEMQYGIGREVEEELTGIGPDNELLVERTLDDLVMIDLEQWRFDARAGLEIDAGLIEKATLRFGYSDYEHAELEDGVPATYFRNDAFEARLELMHRPIGAIEGAWGLQYSRSLFEATGDEAFLRPTETNKGAIFAFEEWDLERAVVQFGGRIERQEIRPERYERDDIEGRDSIPEPFHKTGGSVSGGVVWPLRDGLRLNVAANYTQRLPNAQELYADGPHVGTFAYEISDHVETGDFSREEAWGIDLGVRGRTPRVRWESAVFFVRFDDFIQLQRTGELAFENVDGSFDVVPPGQVDERFLEERRDRGEETAFLPVTRFVLSEANYYGFETEAVVHLLADPLERLDLILRADYVEARDRRTREPLARIPPLRMSGALEYAFADWTAGARYRYQFRQSRVPGAESITPGYAMIDLLLGRTIHRDNWSVDFSARVENLLDREAREATSFMRDLAPHAGRNLIVSVDIAF